ncbi:MAG: hypothetical protein LBN39_06475 [Planctomycetaceae bacterium]|nr:hypothetical protein [Planctomycetaceae bacterium]
MNRYFRFSYQRRESFHQGVLISREVRYFVSLLDASQVSAERFLELVGGTRTNTFFAGRAWEKSGRL